jgi:hypothetical protein
MATQAEILDQVSKLLKEGKVQEADDLAQRGAADARIAESKSSGKDPAPAPKRDPAVIKQDLITEVVTHLGSPPRLLALLEELYPAAPEK